MSERDIEIGELFNFIIGKEIKTVLDIGCYGSDYIDLLKLVKGYDVTGIDFLKDNFTRIDKYIVGDFETFPLDQFDLTIALSTIEHAGVWRGGFINNYREKQMNCLKRTADLALKYFYITVPFGVPGVLSTVEDGTFFSNITIDMLEEFLQYAKQYKTTINYYYNFAGIHTGTYKPVDEEVALKAPCAFPVPCVCIIKGEKI
jgi:SAM-dependent methyltransferase